MQDYQWNKLVPTKNSWIPPSHFKVLASFNTRVSLESPIRRQARLSNEQRLIQKYPVSWICSILWPWKVFAYKRPFSLLHNVLGTLQMCIWEKRSLTKKGSTRGERSMLLSWAKVVTPYRMDPELSSLSCWAMSWPPKWPLPPMLDGATIQCVPYATALWYILVIFIPGCYLVWFFHHKDFMKI